MGSRLPRRRVGQPLQTATNQDPSAFAACAAAGQACVDAQSWPSNLLLAINVSQFQLKGPMLAERVLAVLAHTNFDPKRLEVEVTESALMSDIEAARTNLQALQRAGVSVALDDFGTGYSSLSHLRDINFDRIKIDRSLFRRLANLLKAERLWTLCWPLAEASAFGRRRKVSRTRRTRSGSPTEGVLTDKAFGSESPCRPRRCRVISMPRNLDQHRPEIRSRAFLPRISFTSK